MLSNRLIDSLYTEAMVLADEARSYFDDPGTLDLSPIDRVRFSCESLKVTTRLMHIVAWLLTHRANASSDALPAIAPQPIGTPIISDEQSIARLPGDAQRIVRASIDLFKRIERLEAPNDGGAVSPALSLQDRLQRAF